MVHQINQLKEEIEIKDTELIQENKNLAYLIKLNMNWTLQKTN